MAALVVLAFAPLSDATQIQPVLICVTSNKVARVSRHCCTPMALQVVLSTVSLAVSHAIFACCVTQKSFTNVSSKKTLDNLSPDDS